MRRLRHLRHRLHRWWVRLMWVGVIIVAVGTVAVAATVVAPGLGPSDAGAGDTGAGVDGAAVEQAFLERLNEQRHDRGLQPVSKRGGLTAMGQAHSRDMAEHDYLSHEQPDGTTIADRYKARGLLPTCRLPAPDGGVYAGAENVIRYPLNGVSSESTLASGLLTAWMDSPEHRAVLLLPAADEAGLGITVADGTAYAALELC